MSDWGASVYGDPCHGCGFLWTTTVDDAVSFVSDLPTSYGEMLSKATGAERHPDLAWSVSEYVCHVGDNLRIWAERLAGVSGNAVLEVGRYDQDLLAQARSYATVPLRSALWSLRRAVANWQQAVEQTRRTGAVLVNPERGGQTRSDVVGSNTHDAFHHRWDIRRSIDSAQR